MQRFASVACFAAGVALGALVGALTGSPARAQCGGICLYEVGTPQQGSSYAGASAAAEDAATAFLNPAGMTRFEKAEILGGLVGVVSELDFDAKPGTVPPPPGFTNDGGNAGGLSAAAGSYAVSPLADRLWLGVAVNGIYGGAVNYHSNWIARTFVTDASLLVLNFQPTLALKMSDWLSVGAGPNFLYGALPRFESRPVPLAPQLELRANGADDWTVAGSVGVLLEPREDTRVGFTYRSQADFHLEGGDAPGFAYDFTLPQGFNVGLFHQATPKLALLADAGWSDWSAFSSESISFGSPPAGPVTLDFTRRWRDTWRVATGLQYELAERWLAQAGFSYDSSPVKGSRRTPDLPVSEQYRFSTGIQYDLSESTTLGLAYTFLWLGNPEIDNVTIPPTALGVVLDGRYEPAYANLFSVTVTWRFCSPLPWVPCPAPPPAST